MEATVLVGSSCLGVSARVSTFAFVVALGDGALEPTWEE